MKAGEYLLEMNGRDILHQLYTFFQETAGKQVTLKVTLNPGMEAGRAKWTWCPCK